MLGFAIGQSGSRHAAQNVTGFWPCGGRLFGGHSVFYRQFAACGVWALVVARSGVVCV